MEAGGVVQQYVVEELKQGLGGATTLQNPMAEAIVRALALSLNRVTQGRVGIQVIKHMILEVLILGWLLVVAALQYTYKESETGD
jgi:hypothetical protein